VFKVNHLGKVKSSFMVDPQILTQAKIGVKETDQKGSSNYL